VSATPAGDHQLNIRDEEETTARGNWLSEEQAQSFYHAVAQLLFLSGRARRDIQVAVAFLTTRVRRPDADDWSKLKRVLQYLQGIKHMKLTLCFVNLGQVCWWVDVSYNVHEDCKGQTGAIMSMGHGAFLSFSRKQKLNVRSSCEGELVGVDDAMPWILWCKYFIKAQGYTVEQNILYQDNKSTILLATNGRWSSGKRTKHIKSRYFFVKDKVESGDLEIQHMPTDRMWSDVLTKPKQGRGFREMRATLMNVPVEYDDETERLDTPACLLPPDALEVQDAGTESKTFDYVKPMASAQDNLGPHHRRSVLSNVQNVRSCLRVKQDQKYTRAGECQTVRFMTVDSQKRKRTSKSVH
jgi:hypothetical protein